MISKVQGDGYADYDIDSYVDKLESLIKKKLKIYNLLGKKLDGFKKSLKEEDEIRLKVKDTFYYWSVCRLFIIQFEIKSSRFEN